MNYTELTAAIEAYTENDETTFVANIPNFVKQAEQRVFNNVLFPSLRKTVTGTMTSSNRYLACPSDFLACFSLAVIDGNGAYSFLLNKDESFIREAFPNPATTAQPTHYAIFGTRSDDEAELTFLLGPTPDSGYTAALNYFYYPETIVTASTSWLGDNFDSVLLYGSLVEAYIFMKGEADMMKLYDDKYKEALALAIQLGNGMEAKDAYRAGIVVMPR